MNKNKCIIYKNDLKFEEDNKFEEKNFESDIVKSIYENFKNKPKIELRLKDSEMENYNYLDLSKLYIDDTYLIKLFDLEKINGILKKIEFLDLSNNLLKSFPNLNKYPNIIYLNVSFNSIEQDIIDDNLIELTCHDNLIKSIKSNKLTHVNASNNKIELIDIPNIKFLIINNNKLDEIQSYLNLEFLECIDNSLLKIDNMINLEELYIGNNKIKNIYNMPKLKILNCIGNPLEKIKYFPNLITLISSICIISSQFNVNNISKIGQDYLIDFNV